MNRPIPNKASFAWLAPFFLAGSLIMTSVGCEDDGNPTGPGEDEPYFMVSPSSMSHGEATTAKCRELFGAAFRIADWNDIKARFSAGDRAEDILPSNVNGWVTRNGVFKYSETRWYFASREPVHAGFLKHDVIGNVFALGSWDSNYNLLCFNLTGA